MSDPATQENLLETYIKENKKELAVELLFDLITQNARARDFSKNEYLINVKWDQPLSDDLMATIKSPALSV
jgi:hypothetical protein